MAQPSVFIGKDKANKLQGFVTVEGDRLITAARKRLAVLFHRVMGQSLSGEEASIGDTLEYLARGEKSTIAYLERRKAREGVARGKGKTETT